MKYPKLNSLIPQGEHFDESAINTEGVWLTTSHVNNLEEELGRLSGVETDSKNAVTAAEDHQKVVDQLNDKISNMETAATTSANRIHELEGQVAQLGKQSSGTGTVIKTATDEVVTESSNKKITLNSPEHPINQLADRKTGAGKK